MGSASRAEFPVSLSNLDGFTSRLIYSSTHHSSESFILLKTGWAQDAWLQWSHENWYFHLDISHLKAFIHQSNVPICQTNFRCQIYSILGATTISSPFSYFYQKCGTYVVNSGQVKNPMAHAHNKCKVAASKFLAIQYTSIGFQINLHSKSGCPFSFLAWQLPHNIDSFCCRCLSLNNFLCSIFTILFFPDLFSLDCDSESIQCRP